MLAGQLALAIGVGLLPFSPNLGIFIGVNTLVAMGFGMNNPSVSSTVSKVAPDKEKGFVLGGVQSMGSLGRILGPVAGTIVFQQFAVSAPFTLGATVLAITLLLTLFFVP
jgi:DHA1 family tetracycline resistance protein-like MFS transporter